MAVSDDWNSAYEWASKNSETSSNKESWFFWFVIFGILILLIVAYYLFKRWSNKNGNLGALNQIQPNGKYPKLLVDGRGNAYAK